MHPHDPDDGPPRKWYRHPVLGNSPRRRAVRARRLRPVVESLETRDLPSTHAASASVAHASRPATATVQAQSRTVLQELEAQAAGQGARTDASTGLTGKKPAGPFLSEKVIQKYVNLLYGPGSATPMTPTAQEVNRQTFTARWSAEYTIGPPRFTDRESTIHIWSKDGGSNAFLIGKLDMLLFPPANPAATPNPGNPYANQVTGVSGLFAQNYLQTGSLVVLDLNSTPGAGANPDALPTQLSWTFDANGAGAFVAPRGFTQGAGQLDLQWIPDAHPVAGSLGSGKVIVTFQGVINFNQIASSISRFYM
jgi:hypothetical protein